MWETINQTLLIVEIILAAIGILFVRKKKNAIKTFVFMGLLFILDFTIYIVPALYDKLVLGESRSFLFYLSDIFPASLKLLAGDGSTGMVDGYAAVFPLYSYIFIAGLLLSLISTSYVAISVFGYKILNVFKTANTKSLKSCDIITGNSDEALNYAKAYKNTIIALSKDTDKSVANELISSGYTVIRRKITKEFLNGRFFNTKTKYNIIILNDTNNHYNEVNNALSYFDECSEAKKIHFYIETDENAIATEKNLIDTVGKEYREKITLFSRNELIARTFVDENPLTKDMPEDFFNDDSSLKENVTLNMFILGFGSLNREIYRQFIINNQFCVYKNGEYKASPINYYIYDKSVNEKIWEINGLSDTLSALSENKDAYFPLPDMPYNTKCIQENCFEFDCIKKIAKKVDEQNSFSYILIDTGDVYKNIEIAERFNLLLGDSKSFCIFIYNNSRLSTYGNINCYGNTDELFTHSIIVNESLADLARSINSFYSGSDTWNKLTYFDMYSNISLACNLRFKLNLLKLDYIKDKKLGEEGLLEKVLQSFHNKDFSYEDYFEKNTRNALLAQEHLRWNAYHLLSGYLPMKKAKIIVEKNEQSNTIKKTTKNNTLKKHACVTTYKGLDELSKFLAGSANQISSEKVYTAADFDYYKYDDLLLRTIPEFFRQNNFSVIKKSLTIK